MIFMPAGITRHDVLNASQIIKNSLDTPEAAGGKCCGFRIAHTYYLTPVFAGSKRGR
jgi:hypothetical protein